MAGFWSRLRQRQARGSRRFVAVEFDSRSIRAALAERTGSGARILRLHEAAAPAPADLGDAQKLGAIIGRQLAAQGMGSLPMAMCAPRSRIVLKAAKLPPKVAPGELPAMVQYQAEKDLPFRADEAVIDFAVSSHYTGEAQREGEPAGEATDVLIAAVRVPVADFHRSLAQAAGCYPLHLAAKPWADVECVLSSPNLAPDGLVIVHVGPDETEITIIEDREPSMTRSAGVKLPAPLQRRDAINEAAASVAMEVTRTIQSYQVAGRKAVRSVVVAGGTGIEPQLVDDLAARTRLPCQLYKPAVALPVPDAQAAAPFISLVGLAMAAGRGELALDFLNPKRPQAQTGKRTRRTAAAIAAAVVLGVGVITAVAMVSSQRAQANRQALELDKARKESKVVDALIKRVGTLDGWVATGRPWLDHLAALSAMMPPAEQAYVTALNVNTENTVSITIRARSSEAIARLNERIGAADYDVKPGKIGTVSDQYGYTQEMTLQISPPRRLEFDLAAATPASRPADDDSAAALASRTSGYRPPYTPPQPAAPAPAAPAGPISAGQLLGNYAQSTFEALTRDDPTLANTPVQFTCKLSAGSGRFVVPGATAEQYVSYRGTDPSNAMSRRSVYMYARKDTDVAKALEGAMRRIGEVNARGLTIWGRATYSKADGRTGIIIDRVVERDGR
jgi:Tfp pilus assembly PilM family ATPase